MPQATERHGSRGRFGQDSRFWFGALTADAILGTIIGVTGVGELQPLPLGWSALILLSQGLLVLGPNNAIKVFQAGRAARTCRDGSWS